MGSDQKGKTMVKGTPSGAVIKVGRKVGNFEVVGKLGEGGMGAVWAAEHPFLGSKVAIKVLAARVLGNPEAVTRFQNEARAVSRLDHPNIVKITDFGELSDGSPYYVMEHLEGRELGDVIRAEAPMTPEAVLAYAEPICSAPAAAGGGGGPGAGRAFHPGPGNPGRGCGGGGG